jgi:putative membrane-bound dehydrogenase-like protein
MRIRLAPKLLCATYLLATVVPQAHGQLSPQETVQRLRVADGFELSVFAAEPLVTNPTSIDVDAYGRVWVCEGQWYRAAAKNPPADCVKVLEDTDGDGQADRATVFADGLLVPLGVCVAGPRIYVSEAPNIWLYEDRDGDLKPDGPRRLFLSGFRGFNHDHGVHGLIVGPDHKLYFTQGDQGLDVTGPDGTRLQYPWGAMLRCELDGTKLESFAVNFRNPYELAVNSFGQVWCSDNDNDGLNSVRICWILEGGNYGWYGYPLMLRRYDGFYDPKYHWRAHQPGIVPYVLITGFGSPAGMTFCETEALGPELLGQLIHADAGPREVRAYKIAPAGAAYRLEPTLLCSGPDEPYFRPVDVCFGPDGSLYIADWYDQGVGGHAYNNPHQGRIYVLKRRGTPRQRRNPPVLATVSDAIEGLESPNLATQFLARETLLQQGQEALPALRHLVRARRDYLAARALWLLDRLGEEGQNAVAECLQHTEANFRALAIRILRRHGTCYANDLAKRLTDPEPEVRRELLMAVPSFPPARQYEALLDLARTWDGSDRFYLEAVLVAAKRHRDWPKRLVEDLVNRQPVWTQREVLLLLGLSPDEAPRRLLDAFRQGAVDPEGIRTSVEALVTSDEAEAWEFVGQVAGQRSEAPEVRATALDGLRYASREHADELQKSPWLKAALSAAWQEPNLRRAVIVLAAEAKLTWMAPVLVSLAQDGNASAEERIAAVRTVGQLGSREDAQSLTSLLQVQDRSLRRAVVATLLTTGVVEPLLRLLKDTSPSDARWQDVAQELLSHSEGALRALSLLAQGTLQPEVRRELVSLGLRTADPTIRSLFAPYAKDVPLPKTLAEGLVPQEVLALEGNPERGRALFETSGAAPCIQCHMVQGKGGDIGPDLSQIGRKYDRRGLLDAILRPSAAIAPEYRPYLVQTTDGKVMVGFLRQKTSRHLVLKTAQGQLVEIPVDRVEQCVPQETSLMPELTLASLTAQDAADLLAYLASLRETVQTITEWWALGPFPNPNDQGLDLPYLPEAHPDRVDLEATYRTEMGRELRWEPVGAMLFRGRPGVDIVRICHDKKLPSQHVVFYLAVTIHSPEEQQGELLLGSDDGVKVWLNGQLRLHRHAHRSAEPAQERISLPLKKGANLLLVKLEQVEGDSGLLASVQASSVLSFSTPGSEHSHRSSPSNGSP